MPTGLDLQAGLLTAKGTCAPNYRYRRIIWSSDHCSCRPPGGRSASSPTARSRNRRLALAEGSFPDHQSRTRTGPRVRPRVRRVRVHHPCCFTRRVPNGRSRAVDEYMMPLNPLAAPQLAPRSARLSERKRARCTRRCRAKVRPSLSPTGLHGSSPFSLTSSGSTNCSANGHEFERVRDLCVLGGSPTWRRDDRVWGTSDAGSPLWPARDWGCVTALARLRFAVACQGDGTSGLP
ncbi:hypothetical protein BN1232_05632 [Mycobacterium lentiflavum]|uniref:Uncharacterized protein n=1 Tax=Mycobacterium lentiflavum TaxID=141349 RepID=A0A0E4H1W8_MYCLN|nr:hypothetical protein BN1232_05632 [Mycobacterium lentiflavum]